MTRLRTVFFVSDRTGITAETLGNTLLTQFDGFEFRRQTLPFVNTPERAQRVIEMVAAAAADDAEPPLVFSTTVNEEVRNILRTTKGLFLDLFDSYIHTLEDAFGQPSTHTVGRAHGIADTRRYSARIAAMNFAMEHDDGQSLRHLERADVILVAPSRCGKTPTSLYLALQHGIYASNYPLIDEDLDHLRLPEALQPHAERLFGLTADAERLSQVRGERRPGSRYASLEQCNYEVRQAEQFYRRRNIPFVNSTHMSVEEIATMAMQEKGLRRDSF